MTHGERECDAVPVLAEYRSRALNGQHIAVAARHSMGVAYQTLGWHLTSYSGAWPLQERRQPARAHRTDPTDAKGPRPYRHQVVPVTVNLGPNHWAIARGYLAILGNSFRWAQ